MSSHIDIPSPSSYYTASSYRTRLRKPHARIPDLVGTPSTALEVRSVVRAPYNKGNLRLRIAGHAKRVLRCFILNKDLRYTIRCRRFYHELDLTAPLH